MKWLLSLVAFLVLLAGVLIFHRDEKETLPVAPAPEVSWQEFDGSKHTLSEAAGRPVILHFWASWCGPCQQEFPSLIAAASRHKNILFLTVSSDKDRPSAERFIRMAEAMTYAKRTDNLHYAFDPDKALTFDVFQTVQYPETIMLDGTHHMLRKYAGTVDWSSKAIQDELNQLK